MDEPSTFGVLLANRASVEARLCALNRRAARKRLPLLSWSWGRPVTAREILSHEGAGDLPGALFTGQGGYSVPVTRVELSLAGQIKLEGWRFIATLQHLDGENIVRALPGETVPAAYRNAGPACGHCNASRRRADTFLVAKGDQIVQVGSSCIGDFLGTDAAESLAWRACLFAEARAMLEDGETSFGGASDERPLAAFLAYVAWCVRSPGHGWTSRTKALNGGGKATADKAWQYMSDGEERRKAFVAVTPEDEATADAAEAWASELSDDEVGRAAGDYLHNLRALARGGLVRSRDAGLAGSMVVAYQNAVGFAKRRAERSARVDLDAYQGAVGAKCTWGLAPKVGKKGQALKGAPLVVSSEPVKLDFVTGYATEYGYTTVLKFRTTDGACLVWKASSTTLARGDVGKTYTLAGTVKAHEEYKGAKQTILSRCSVEEVPAAAPVEPS